MATVNSTQVESNFHNDDTIVVTWEALTTTNDNGSEYEDPNIVGASFQVIGTFGSGGTLKIQGSNDGTNWLDLNDPQGDPISLTAAAIVKAQELTKYVRPFVSAGDGTTDLDVIMYVRRDA